MNFGSGTVQFGMEYGIANKIGRPSAPEVDRILSMAYEAGFRMLDTAPGYGDSEEMLGNTSSVFPGTGWSPKHAGLRAIIPGIIFWRL